MSIEEIFEFIDLMTEEEFMYYISPTSYYNTNYEYILCSDDLEIDVRKMLEFYYFIKENKDNVDSYVYERLLSFIQDPDEIDHFSVDWTVIILNSLGQDWKKRYQTFSSSISNKEKLNLINLNENFNRKDYYIINDKYKNKSYYCQNIVDAAYFIHNQGHMIDYKKIDRGLLISFSGVDMKKNDYILYNDFNEFKINDNDKKSQSYSKFIQKFREYQLKKLLNDSFVIKFSEFNKFS